MSMTSRDRFIATLRHKRPDRTCVDFGATHVTGIHASVVSKLRNVLLGGDDFRVKIVEPYQMLGEIDDELAEAMGVDVVGVMAPRTMFGFVNEDWKPFTLFDGTEVLVPGQFNVTEVPGGGWYIYPEGDMSVPPSGHMPRDGFYFDALCRQGRSTTRSSTQPTISRSSGHSARTTFSTSPPPPARPPTRTRARS